MATRYVSINGTQSVNYASWAALAAAETKDLVANTRILDVEIGAGNAGVILLSGWTTSADYYINIHVTPAAKFTASDIISAAAAMSAKASRAHIYIDGTAVSLAAYNVVIDGLFVISNSTDYGASEWVIGTNSPAIIENCAFVQIGLATDGADSANGIYTGKGFTGRIVNTFVAAYCTVDFTNGVTCFDVNCAAANNALINCTAYSDLDDNIVELVVMKNYARGVNVLTCTAGTSAKCYASDGNGLAYLYNSIATDSTITDVFVSNFMNCLENVVKSSLFTSDVGTLSASSPARKIGLTNAYASTDAFTQTRIKFDIGFYQTLLINTADLTTFFKDIGQIIRSANQYKTLFSDLIQVGSTLKQNQFNSGLSRFQILSDLLGDDMSAVSSFEQWAKTAAQRISTYLRDYVIPETMDTGTSDIDALEALDYWLLKNSYKVKGILLTSNYEVDSRNTGVHTLESIVLPQILDTQIIELKCITADSADSEGIWQVSGSNYGDFGTTATTGTAYEHDSGLTFTITRDGTNYAAVDDKIYLFVSASADVVFQTYMRDNFDFVFTQNDTTGAENILDSWAA